MASGSANRFIFTTPRTGGASVPNPTLIDTTEMRVYGFNIRRDMDLGTELVVLVEEGIVENDIFKPVAGRKRFTFSGQALTNQLDLPPADPSKSRWAELEETVFTFLRAQGKIPDGTFTSE